MTSDFQEFKDQFFAFVENAQRIVITSHMSPDDDSIGSVLLAHAVLTRRYPASDIRIVYTGQAVERYSVFHNFERIEWVDDIGNHLDGVDLLITMDASSWKRFSKLPEQLQAVPTRIGIDHHASEPDAYTLLLHRKEYSSNTELVYRALLEGEPLAKEVAELVLLGIVGDTNGLAYVQPHQNAVFSLAKDLVQIVGMSIDQFRSQYMGIPIRLIPLLQALVANARYETIEGWPPVQYSYISRDMMIAAAGTDEDMSAASHIYMGQYLTRVEGYGWGFVVTPRSDGGCRMSGRSLATSVNVRDFHERLGIGSGHDRASGGYFADANPTDCIARVIAFMQMNAPVI